MWMWSYGSGGKGLHTWHSILKPKLCNAWKQTGFQVLPYFQKTASAVNISHRGHTLLSSRCCVGLSATHTDITSLHVQPDGGTGKGWISLMRWVVTWPVFSRVAPVVGLLRLPRLNGERSVIMPPGLVICRTLSLPFPVSPPLCVELQPQLDVNRDNYSSFHMHLTKAKDEG